MWPSFDVHKVMIEQTELTKKHDFFFLLNQIQSRLLMHTSKRPLCPDNGSFCYLYFHLFSCLLTFKASVQLSVVMIKRSLLPHWAQKYHWQDPKITLSYLFIPFFLLLVVAYEIGVWWLFHERSRKFETRSTNQTRRYSCLFSCMIC